MRIHNLAEHGETQATPVCTIHRPPTRKPSSALFIWSLCLTWEVNKPDEEEADDPIDEVIWPSFVKHTDRTRILAAYKPGGKPWRLSLDPGIEQIATVSLATGSTKLEVLVKQPVRVTRLEVKASEGKVIVRQLLRLEVGRDAAPLLCDLDHNPVHLAITGQLPIWAATNAEKSALADQEDEEEEEEDEDEEEEDEEESEEDDPQGPEYGEDEDSKGNEPAPARDPYQAQRDPRTGRILPRKKGSEPLPPEPEDVA